MSRSSYIEKFDIVQDIKPGGIFLLNCSWNVDELTARLPAAAKKYLAENNIKFYTVDAIHLAAEIGLGGRTNTILQSAFFKLSNILPIDTAVKAMKDAIVESYGHKGEKVINMNMAAGTRDLIISRRYQFPRAGGIRLPTCPQNL